MADTGWEQHKCVSKIDRKLPIFYTFWHKQVHLHLGMYKCLGIGMPIVLVYYAYL